MNIGIAFAILGMLILSFSKLAARKASAAGRPLTAAVGIHVILAATVALLAALFGSFAVPPNILLYISTVAIGAAAIVPLYVAYQKSGLGIPTAIASAFAPITIVLAVAFYGERFSWIVWLGMALVFIGVLLSAVNFRSWNRPEMRKGLGWAFLTMIGWGVYFFLIKDIVDTMGVWPATVALEAGVAAMILVVSIPMRAIGIPKQLGWVAATGVSDGVGVLAYYAGVASISASVAATIMQSSVVVCAILAVIFLQERFDTVQKVGIITTFVGLVLVTI